MTIALRVVLLLVAMVVFPARSTRKALRLALAKHLRPPTIVAIIAAFIWSVFTAIVVDTLGLANGWLAAAVLFLPLSLFEIFVKE